MLPPEPRGRVPRGFLKNVPFVKSKCTKKQKYFLGGQNEGYFFPEKLLGAQITEHFAGVVV